MPVATTTSSAIRPRSPAAERKSSADEPVDAEADPFAPPPCEAPKPVPARWPPCPFDPFEFVEPLEEDPFPPCLLPDAAEAEPFPSALPPSLVVPVGEEPLGFGLLA